MFSKKTKEQHTFNITVHSLRGESVMAGDVFSCRWARGSKAENSGETQHVEAKSGSVVWKETVPITSTLVRTPDGTYAPKEMTFTVLNHIEDKESVLGKASIKLSNYAGKRGPLSKTFPIAEGLSLLVKVASPDADTNAASDEETENQQATSAPSRGVTPVPPPPTPPPPPKPISVYITSLVGAALKPHSGKVFRLEYQFAQEIARHTEFVDCFSAAVHWNHWMYLPSLGSNPTGKIHFTLQAGRDTARAGNIFTFVVDIAKISHRSEAKFPIPIKNERAVLTLTIKPFQPPPEPKIETIVAQHSPPPTQQQQNGQRSSRAVTPQPAVPDPAVEKALREAKEHEEERKRLQRRIFELEKAVSLSVISDGSALQNGSGGNDDNMSTLNSHIGVEEDMPLGTPPRATPRGITNGAGKVGPYTVTDGPDSPLAPAPVVVDWGNDFGQQDEDNMTTTTCGESTVLVPVRKERRRNPRRRRQQAVSNTSDADRSGYCSVCVVL
eukprot:PhM_4_TR5829/c0_g1_i1/m.26952